MHRLSYFLILVLALFFAFAVQAQTGVNDAELNGNYAFTFTGVRGNGTVSSVYGAVGRFAADGAGNITNGELDTNTVGGGVAAQSFSGTYAIGADHRGLIALNISGSTAKLAFAMLANGNAQFIEFDAAGGTGTIGSGTMEKADTTAFSTASITGDYAFGAAGFDNANNRAAVEGRFTSNGTGVLSSPAGDLNAYGTEYPMTFTAANYSVSDAATGRGTMHLAFTFGGAPASLNSVFYVVNSGKVFFMESDTVSTATPLLNGVMVQQSMPTAGFSNASLNGNQVIYLTGHSMCGSASGVPKVVAGLLTANGSGSLSLTYDENFCSAPNSITAAPGTYNVAGNGRATITIGGYSLVAYLVNPNQLFLFVSDSNVLFGTGEPQAAVSFTNSTVNGTYAGFASIPVSYRVTVFSGEFAANGASPTGNITGAEDISTPSGPHSGAAFSATYSISSSPTNGRGIMTITSGGGSSVVYMISPSKFVAVSQSDPYPALMEFNLSSVPSTVSPASLSFNPSSVVGGSQSSTGTVTLSGPAPAGGAQVAVSSNNPAVASVPSSVTVAAGTASASFTVTTSAVAASTAVSISATYGGATKTASLTVTPTPPPPPTLSSLSLNPTSVVGGVQSSTGTVTLSGPAPAGGAQIAVSSSNPAVASAPSSVTVAAGATSTSFTVSTSAVTAPVTVTISAAYNGVSRSASLNVRPPLPTVSSVSLNPTSVVGGVQTSSGTVTLSGPAPSGGAVVALSSSNGAASVPSRVTVPSGATRASFTVNTSIVLISTSSTISASYNGSARSATLAVLL